MTKADLVAEVWATHGALSRAEAARAVDTVLGLLRSALAAGRPVRIRDFGAFEIADRRARVANVPAGGARGGAPAGRRVSVAAGRRLRFAPGSRLLRALAESPRTEES
jgi:nucleoid DNA-binding protein